MAVHAQIAEEGRAPVPGAPAPAAQAAPVPQGPRPTWPPMADGGADYEPTSRSTGRSAGRSARAARPSGRALLMLVLLATVIGAVLGGAFGWWGATQFTAVTLVQGAPAALQPRGADATDERYAQTEVAYAGIDRAEMRAEVQRRTGNGDASEAAVSVMPGTTLLQFTGQGETAEGAVQSANVSAETYVDQWRARTSAVLTESLAIIDAQLAAPGGGDQARTAQLQEQRATLGAQQEAVATTKRIIKPAAEADRSPGYASGVVLGALLGAVAGTGAALVWRRR